MAVLVTFVSHAIGMVFHVRAAVSMEGTCVHVLGVCCTIVILMAALATRFTDRMHVQVTAAAEAQRSTPEGQRVAENSRGGSLEYVPVSAHGKLFATSGEDGHVAVWHTPTSLRVRTFGRA